MSDHVDLSEAAAARPLTPEDVASLVGGDVRRVTGDAAAARVLLRRVRATLTSHEEEVRVARRDLARALEGSRMSASPLSAAVTALGRLTLAEQRQVFDAGTSTLVEGLRAAAGEVQSERVAARNSLRYTRATLSALAADPALDPATRARIEGALAALPQATTDGAAEGLAAELDVLEAPGRPFSVMPAAASLDVLFDSP